MEAPAAATPAPKRAAEGSEGHEVPIRRKKHRRGGGAAAAENVVDAKPEEFVRVVPYRRAAVDDERLGPVLLSKSDKSSALTLSEDRVTVSGRKGFRSVRATHGAHVGTWYCEAHVEHLGATGHMRLGWSTRRAEIDAPVGFDGYGYGYRDVDGSKVGLRGWS
jgi:Set1/Ash2 histone methyltransferase complex subunit ASH2